MVSHLKELGCFYTTASEQPLRRSIEDKERILELIQENPRMSVQEIAREIHIPPTTVWQILNSNRLYPYHLTPMTPVATILPGDLERRPNFCQWMVEVEYVHLHNRILFSDESLSMQDGIFNSRNKHLWAEDNPHAAIQTKSQHKFTVHVWCGILGNSLIDPHYFHDTLNAQ